MRHVRGLHQRAQRSDTCRPDFVKLAVYLLAEFMECDLLVPTEEHDDRHQRLPWKLNDDVTKHKCLPRIGLCWALPNFIQCSLNDKVRHDLLDELAEDGEQHENCEHLILETLLTELSLEEGESDEKSL